jgi:CHAT domain-containing protein
LNSYLYAPVAGRLRDKKHLYLVTSKFLSYVPYGALITGKHEDGSPRFLVEDKIISLNRLAFLAGLNPQEAKKTLSSMDIIAVGNPKHTILDQSDLGGAEVEAQVAVNAMRKINPNAKTALFLTTEATESAWLKAVSEIPYSIMYFATHGVPFAETMFFESGNRDIIEKAEIQLEEIKARKREGNVERIRGRIERARAKITFIEETFPNKSHMYAYLYMTYPDEGFTGTLTLKKILELPASIFNNAHLAVLSACNSAVTYSPKVLHDEKAQDALENPEARKALVEAGWTPGVDQVCLMDSFMKRNFRNVYGNYWAADDNASAFIMERFMANLERYPVAAAYREAQLEFLRNPPKSLDYTQYPTHPTYWACGSLFGQ